MDCTSKVLYFFGVKLKHKNENISKHPRSKKVLLSALRLYWDIVITYFAFAILYFALFNNDKLFSVHVFDVFLIAVLRLVFHFKIRKIMLCFEKLEMRRVLKSLRKDRYLNLYVVIFIFLQFTLNFISLIRTLNSEILPPLFDKISTFHLFETQTLNLVPNCVLRLIWICFITLCNIFPPIVAMICFFVSLAMYKLVHNLSSKLQKSHPANYVRSVTDYVSRMTILLKELNQELSVLLFLLFGYWIATLFFIASKIILKPAIQNNVSTIISYVDIANFGFQSTVLAVMGSKLENEFLESRNILCTMTPQSKMQNDQLMFFRSVDVQFLLSVLENARQQATITAWGIFKIEKKLVLAIFGFIITYEVLIIQFIEPNRYG